MKTETRARIVELIRAPAGARPVELVKALGISPQAVHRHLRLLKTEGTIEVLGRGPRARYRIAGAPRLDGVRRWWEAEKRPPESPAELLCATRDVFSARLGRLSSLTRAGLAPRDLPLVISAAGEIGNNCFDHNLGHWRDVPGCWFETQTTGGRLWICVADRGQGVFRSLSRADPSLPDDQSALIAAFERTLSGRAPENRGNGLKFVRNVADAEGRGLACRSGTGLAAYGALAAECRAELARFSPRSGGTITLLLWSMA